MSEYRSAEPVSVTTIPLKKLDATALTNTLLTMLGMWMVAMLIGTFVLVRLVPSNLIAVVGPFFAIGNVVVVVVLGYRTIRRLTVHLFNLEIGESFLRLRAPNGDTVADTRTGDLSFTRCTYMRRGKNTAWVRPGWRMKHPQGDHLIGTLWPQDPFENVARDERTPDFELDRTQFDAFKERVDSVAT